MPYSGLHKTTTQTIGYAPLFVLLLVKGLNVTFKYFERKLSNDRYEKELQCKDIVQFALKI